MISQSFNKKPDDLGSRPYKDDVLNRIYNQFFCDDIELFRTTITEQTYPWSILLDKKSTREQLEGIVQDDAVESRAKVFAHRALNLSEQHIYGAIVEVAVDRGLSVVAAYRDGSARCITNYGKLIEWEDLEDEKVRNAIITFLSASQYVLANMERWKQARLGFPTKGLARYTFLSSDGYYFAQGTMEKMIKDPYGKPVIDYGMELMLKIEEKRG